MTRHKLDGSYKQLDLGGGYRLTAPGLVGTAELHGKRAGSTRGPEQVADALSGALTAASFAETRTLEMAVRSVPPPPSGRPLRSAQGEDALLLEVPDLGPEVRQVVLLADETGAVSWHFPEAGPVAGGTARRGGAPALRFLIRRDVPPDDGQGARRGLIGALGRRFLKVLVYPVTDPLLGPIGEHFATKWEARNRPYGLRWFTPEEYTQASGRAIAPEDWHRLAAGRALLFVHGTFSTASGAFGGLPKEVMADLWSRYGGRVFAFDHPTLSEDPRQNIAWLLEQMPVGLDLSVDIICHSRGGLVTRTLAERQADLGGGHVRVGRCVHVGVPNRGTRLADPDHMTVMLDRFTTVLNLIPVLSVQELLEGILLGVKVLGHGLLSGMPGLAAMDPAGEFQAWLNGGPAPAATYYAVTADYEPEGPGLSAKVRTGAADSIFAEPNDLVVPTAGVYAPSHAAFPIPRERLLEFQGSSGVTHVNYFEQTETQAKLREWLIPV